MKSDIPALMRARNLDAVLVFGSTETSSDLAYLVNGAGLENALYLHKVDAEPLLYVSQLEREEAAAAGCAIRLWSEYSMADYLARCNRDRLQATVAIFSDMLRDHGISGRVGFYGFADRGAAYVLLTALAAANPHIAIVGEFGPNLFSVARETKDAAELAALRRVGALTCEVIDAVVRHMQGHAVVDETLVKADGNPLTIGDIKAFIRMELCQRNLEEAHETIFSQGRDAGIGHNRGRPAMPLRLGQAIVFDIFPRDRATGYFADITRSFFLGYAPPLLAARWQQIKQIFDHVLTELRVGELCSTYQAITCDFFEDLGHPTTRSDARTQVGYNHSLGHGVGRDVHESPGLNLLADNTTRLAAGHVVSVEPGLYYPDEGWGLRIEDTVAFDAEGRLINFSTYPYPMVIEIGR